MGWVGSSGWTTAAPGLTEHGIEHLHLLGLYHHATHMTVHSHCLSRGGVGLCESISRYPFTLISQKATLSECKRVPGKSIATPADRTGTRIWGPGEKGCSTSTAAARRRPVGACVRIAGGSVRSLVGL